MSPKEDLIFNYSKERFESINKFKKAAALNQQQQLKNEATKMAIRVPLFYGNKK
jgi:hypothetical protein